MLLCQRLSPHPWHQGWSRMLPSLWATCRGEQPASLPARCPWISHEDPVLLITPRGFSTYPQQLQPCTHPGGFQPSLCSWRRQEGGNWAPPTLQLRLEEPRTQTALAVSPCAVAAMTNVTDTSWHCPGPVGPPSLQRLRVSHLGGVAWHCLG